MNPNALDPALVALLRDAGNRWGPLGVALASATLTDPEILVDRLTPKPDVVWHLELFIPGRAAPQGSKHGFAIAQGRGANRVFTGRVAMKESSKGKVDAWRNDVRAACIPAWDGRPPLDGPLVLEVEFVRSRPKSAPKGYTPEHTTYPDVSKLVRSTEDAITSAGVWADDARVVRLVASKRNAEHDETPGAHIRIGRLPPAREKWEADREAARAVRSGSPRAPEALSSNLSAANPVPRQPHQGPPESRSDSATVGSNALFCLGSSSHSGMEAVK